MPAPAHIDSHDEDAAPPADPAMLMPPALPGNETPPVRPEAGAAAPACSTGSAVALVARDGCGRPAESAVGGCGGDTGDAVAGEAAATGGAAAVEAGPPSAAGTAVSAEAAERANCGDPASLCGVNVAAEVCDTVPTASGTEPGTGAATPAKESDEGPDAAAKCCSSDTVAGPATAPPLDLETPPVAVAGDLWEAAGVTGPRLRPPPHWPLVLVVKRAGANASLVVPHDAAAALAGEGLVTGTVAWADPKTGVPREGNPLTERPQYVFGRHPEA